MFVFLGCFPTEDGLIAPGMQCSFTITFTPDSLANYSEEMQVHVLQYGDTEPPNKGYSGTVILSLLLRSKNVLTLYIGE